VTEPQTASLAAKSKILKQMNTDEAESAGMHRAGPPALAHLARLWEWRRTSNAITLA
jgi:hypothetical protein